VVGHRVRDLPARRAAVAPRVRDPRSEARRPAARSRPPDAGAPGRGAPRSRAHPDGAQAHRLSVRGRRPRERRSVGRRGMAPDLARRARDDRRGRGRRRVRRGVLDRAAGRARGAQRPCAARDPRRRGRGTRRVRTLAPTVPLRPDGRLLGHVAPGTSRRRDAVRPVREPQPFRGRDARLRRRRDGPGARRGVGAALRGIGGGRTGCASSSASAPPRSSPSPRWRRWGCSET
jgi:hypothetical protein